MVCLEVRFPLGVYHGRSVSAASDGPEWPPSPLRLLGALLAAAHGREGDPAEDRALLQRLCEAAPPAILCPPDAATAPDASEQAAAPLRGATRWAPRNYIEDELSPRNLGRGRAAVSKAGMAIGDRPIAVVWPDLELDREARSRLGRLAADVTFVGTTRSPAVVSMIDQPPAEPGERGWVPLSDGPRGFGTTEVRVPDSATVAAFDRREHSRRATKPRVEAAGIVPGIPVGVEVTYGYGPTMAAQASAHDPQWWGEAIVLGLDHERSELVPTAPASYLFTRALRVALLGAYGDPGSPDEAPPILRARGGEPHCAIVPLASIWGPESDGRVLGAAIVLPHRARVPDIVAQRARVEEGLHALVTDSPAQPRRHVQIPGAGRVWLAAPDARAVATATMQFHRYVGPSQTWHSVIPIVHSHWRKGGEDALLRQATADCQHTGLPAPRMVEVQRDPARRGGATRSLSPSRVPEKWRSLIEGPAEHMRISFDAPMTGPVLLGRARHFGLGLCVPAETPEETR
ncbi:MAG: type I-U CRISPR-associated protein Csb2 [Solirubrobacteraceae bacterium]